MEVLVEGEQLGPGLGRSVPGKNSVTSYALPWTITQQESLELCFATSSPVRVPTSGRSPLSRFMISFSWGQAADRSRDLGLGHGYESGRDQRIQ